MGARRHLQLVALSAAFAAVPVACSSGGGQANLFADAGRFDAGRDTGRDTGRFDAGRDTSTIDTGRADTSTTFDAGTQDVLVPDGNVSTCIVPGPVSNGPIPAGTVSTSALVGTRTWSLPSNARLSDDSYASVSSMTGAEESNYLFATNFGFAVPDTATITGISVEVEKRSSTDTALTDHFVRIIHNGVIAQQDRAIGPAWSTFDTVASYGSAADLWGMTWTPDDINASDFGVAFAVRYAGAAGVANAFVDQIRVTVHYTCP